MPEKTNLFIKSNPLEIVNKRFQVKTSALDTGVFTPSYMVVVQDLLSKHFKIIFFSKIEDLGKFMTMLSMVQ